MSDGYGSDPDHPKDYEFEVDVRSAYLAPIFLKVRKPMDVMDVLHAYAVHMGFGLIILAAVGTVRKVLFPRNTLKNYDEGVYQILSFSGRIVPHSHNLGEIIGDLQLIMSNIHGATVGGIVESFVAETTVEVTVCPFYHDSFVSRRFDIHPPRLHGNLFPLSPTEPSPSGEQYVSGESSSSSESSHSSEPNP